MNKELDIYKQNRIKILNIEFKNKVIHLKNVLVDHIKKVQRSRNISNKNKQILITKLINIYNNKIINIKTNFNSKVDSIKNFKPVFNINQYNKKTALLIGINYINTPYQLSGCIDDTTRVKDLLTQRGFNNIKTLTDLTHTKPTKQNILNEFKEMILNADSGDILFFYFSGHGSYTYDKNNDEIDNRDEMIISLDMQGVLDDEFKNILSLNMKKNVTMVGLFDSCHSGTMFDLKFNYLDSTNYNKYTENNKVTECNGNVIMISGCTDSQTSVESYINDKAQGAMTWSFIECINKTPNTSWRELLKSMRDLLKSNSFKQLPQLSTDSFYDIDSNIFF
jgi:hypothetical protein